MSKCFQCIKEEHHGKIRWNMVKDAIVILNGTGYCYEHLKKEVGWDRQLALHDTDFVGEACKQRGYKNTKDFLEKTFKNDKMKKKWGRSYGLELAKSEPQEEKHG